MLTVRGGKPRKDTGLASRGRLAACFAAGAIVLCLLAVSCGSPTQSAVSGSTAGANTRAGEPTCMPTSSLPREFALPAGGSDCVTTEVTLPDGRFAIGTQQGFVGIATGTSVSAVRAASATGAVSDLSVLPSGKIAGFVVDQGMGLIDLTTAKQIKLAGRPLTPDRPNVIGESYYFQFPKPAPRGHDGPLGALVATGGDGTEEAMAIVEHIQPGSSVVCVIYPPASHEAGCVDVSDIVSPLPTVPAATPITGSDPCLSANASPVDPAHQLALTIGYTPGSTTPPASLVVNGGERYTLTLTPADGVIHTLGVYDDQHNLVRDASGTRMCLPSVVGSPITVSFTLVGGPQTLTIRDTAHPQFSVDLVVRAPSAATVATLTPSAGSRVAPVFPTAADARTQTPAPVAATPVP